MNKYLPDVTVDMSAEEISTRFLHLSGANRWHAGNGI